MTRGEGPKLKVSRGVKLFVCSLVEESLPVLQSTGKFDLSYSKVLGSQILKQLIHNPKFESYPNRSVIFKYIWPHQLFDKVNVSTFLL